MKKAILAILIILNAGPALAADGRCKAITVKEGVVYKINAALYKGTHIQLPERLLLPPQGGSDLWTIEGAGHHVMVQPNSSEPQGERTTLTLVTQSNMAYHFDIHRVDFAAADTCVVVKDGNKYFGGSDADPAGAYKTPQEIENLTLQQRLGELQQALQSEKTLSDERIEVVITKYRAMIYTRYEWSAGMGFKGGDLVTDVWDDGRFTFIRVKEDHRGMLAAKAEVDGQEEVLEYKPDSNNVYKISGIYPKFTLVYDKKNKVSVTRRDNQSNGVY
jgi:hypothetical protein